MSSIAFIFFFFNDTATTEIYTLSLHDALPISYLLWSWALAHLAAARVAIFTNLQPLATALLGQLFLGERMTAAFFSAAAVVIAGVLLAQWRATDAAEEALLESPAKT